MEEDPRQHDWGEPRSREELTVTKEATGDREEVAAAGLRLRNWLAELILKETLLLE